MAPQIPEQILSIDKSRDRLRGENPAGSGIEGVDSFDASAVVPIETIEGYSMPVAVDEVKVDIEAGVRNPGGGDPIGGGWRSLSAGRAHRWWRRPRWLTLDC